MMRWWVSGEGRGGRGVRYGYGRIWWVCGCVFTVKGNERTKMMCMGESHSVVYVCECV